MQRRLETLDLHLTQNTSAIDMVHYDQCGYNALPPAISGRRSANQSSLLIPVMIKDESSDPAAWVS